MPDDICAVFDPIDRWCEKHGYSDMLVTIRADGIEFTEFLAFNGNTITWEWQNDWYEGQKDVSLIGFVPVSHLKIVGMEVHYIE